MLIENIFTLCIKIWYEIGEKIHISYDMHEGISPWTVLTMKYRTFECGLQGKLDFHINIEV